MSSREKTLSSLEPRSLHQWLDWLSMSLPASLILIVLANFIVYSKTLNGYFLADDYVHVAYLKHVFDGHPELLANNFYSTWLQTEGTQFYRPFISLTLAFDYLLSGLNPIGFHISNLVYQCLCSIALYLLTREICRLSGLMGNGSSEGTIASVTDEASEPSPAEISAPSAPRQLTTFAPLAAGMLFATHPLHPEVVSWVIARVDSVCCAFYLLAFVLFLCSIRDCAVRSRERFLRLSSNVAFIISLLCKEMAITYPISLTLLLVLFPKENTKGEDGLSKTLPSRGLRAVKQALKLTWQPWLILIVYLIFRSLVLGSVGGYEGSIGEGLSESTVARILSPTSIEKVIFPLNAELFAPLRRWLWPLAIVYGAALALFAVHLVHSGNRSRLLKAICFSFLWFFIVMIPTIPVWNLTESLQGARFIYMGTAPICLFLALLVAPESGRTGEDLSEPRIEGVRTRTGSRLVQWFKRSSRTVSGCLASVLCVALVALYGVIARQNNSAWAHAGSELRALRNEVETTVKNLPDNDKMALLNVPHKYKGAHMIYNAATLSVLLEPPLTSAGIYKRVTTFEPPLFGDDDLIRITRVRSMLTAKRPYHFYTWDRNNRHLMPVQLALDTKEMMVEETCQAQDPVDIDARGNGAVSSAGSVSGSLSSSEPGSASGAKFGQHQPGSGGHQLKENAILLTPVLDTPAPGIDFFDVCLVACADTASGAGENAVPIVIEWNSEQSPSFDSDDSFIVSIPQDGVARRIRLHVSEHKKWLKKSKIHRVCLWSPSKGNIRILGFNALSGENSIPDLCCDQKNFPEDGGGVAHTGGRTGSFSYDASKVSDARAVIFEISNRNAWFDHYSNTYRDKTSSLKVLQSWRSNKLKADGATFQLKDGSGPGFYELRLAATGSDGHIIGYFSDPIMFQIGQ